MSYLVDTNVLSETRKRTQNSGVTAWISTARADTLHLSAITIGEIGRGITRLTERGDHRQAATFQSWLNEIVSRFDKRILPVDIPVAQQWAKQATSPPLATADALIVATAAAHDLTLVTRNVDDFRRTGVRLVNPFAV